MNSQRIDTTAPTMKSAEKTTHATPPTISTMTLVVRQTSGGKFDDGEMRRSLLNIGSPPEVPATVSR